MTATLLVIELNKKNITIRMAKKNDLAEAIYALLQLIPMGCVTTYNDIAKVLRISPRYVARILKENKNVIAVPCHRVIRSDGKIGGYTINGKRIDYFKEKLLKLESLGNNICRFKLDL
uniref:MGMT family protein n=1 Tax=Ignisphaera aggregans TaxID=334771 RepID=A0A7J3QEF6_9CREN